MTERRCRVRTVGVEEELLLVDEGTGEPLTRAAAVLASADAAPRETSVESELHGQQIEFATRPCADLGELANEIRRLRADTDRHARGAGARIAAVATSPLPVSPQVNEGERYRWIMEKFGSTADEQLTCGCHVHVSVDSDEEGVAVLDRIRPWLPQLLALSANSPFWQGQETGYGSYRARVWNRWPSAGPYGVFGSAEEYHAQVAAMVATGVLHDEGMVYFDARLSHHWPTVEIRVADVCLDPRTPVLLAALSRALVDTAAREAADGVPPAPVPTSVLRLASWQAARSGLDSDLLHPLHHTPAPPRETLDALLDHVGEALEANGDLARARTELDRLLGEGNGARVQRERYAKGEGLGEVVRECVRRTAGD
ncbi:carboxylate-amine ligase [Streptomyces sp. DfronAA-171]|nr:glutamate--cysteine ligase [Streptomyces sp. SID4926]SCE36418.1 carboxylate-amine ligase [Streptomyces sp. DfronAA-171]